jgi:glycerol uptake facilitator-like aquaporin
MGINMMIAQVAGAWCGALYWSFVTWSASPMAPIETSYCWYAMCQEAFGAFIFVLFFKIVTDERTHLSDQQPINCFVIAAAYVGARSIVNGSGFSSISSYGACLNPAVAIGITLNSIWFHAGDTLKWFWIYWLMPFAGSLLAILFYRFVYMKTQLMVLKDQQEEKEEHEEAAKVEEYDNTLIDAAPMDE